MRDRRVEIAVRADVLTEYFSEEPAAEAAVALRGEERIIGLFESIVGVGVATEMRVAQVELWCPQ